MTFDQDEWNALNPEPVSHYTRVEQISQWGPDGPLWQARCDCGWHSEDTWTTALKWKASNQAVDHWNQVTRR